MRGGALPAGLLCAAFGLALAFAPRKAIAPALVALCLTAVAGSLAPVTGRSVEFCFLGCWASILLLAGSVHLPRFPPTAATVTGAGLVGLLAGGIISAEGRSTDLATALPAALTVFPASWIIARGWQIALKIALSWLAAIALLAALLPTTGTPGYVPDHMD